MRALLANDFCDASQTRYLKNCGINVMTCRAARRNLQAKSQTGGHGTIRADTPIRRKIKGEGQHRAANAQRADLRAAALTYIRGTRGNRPIHRRGELALRGHSAPPRLQASSLC